MKVKVKEREKEFQPIEIALTIENREELEELWHRLNYVGNKVACSNRLVDFYTAIDKLL